MSNLKESKYFDEAIRVIEIEAQAVLDIKKTLNQDFKSAIKAILESQGRVIVCGMGKSGHIARKIFATFVSTGTPSFYLHPGEAFHGDLGMILPNDIFLALSFIVIMFIYNKRKDCTYLTSGICIFRHNVYKF